MAKYRKGYKVDPETGLTAPEARAGLTREEAEAQAAEDARTAPTRTPAATTPARQEQGVESTGESPQRAGLMGRTWKWYDALSTRKQALLLFPPLAVLLIIIIAVASSGGGGGNKASAPGTTSPSSAPPPPPPAAASGPKKASNGDDAKDVHSRAQQAVNRAEVCLAAVYLASQDTSNVNSMALSLQKARSVCNATRSYLASNNAHGFTDQNTELFGAADEAKSATNAGLAYLDTQYPSKLADFTNHVQSASTYFKQGLNDLNARLSELGVAHVKQ